MKRRSMGKRFIRKTDDKRENNAKADGAHLGMGSSEYRERVLDLQGIDEKQQEEVKLGEKGLRQKEVIPEFNPEQIQYRKEQAELVEKQEKARVATDEKHFTATERAVSHQILKDVQAPHLEKTAEGHAAQTETEEDDHFVKRRLPKLLQEDVYNEGVSLDDFYPGSKTLEKYL